MNKNSYASQISHLYTTNMCCMNQQTKLLIISQLVCCGAEAPGIWKNVLKAKLLDFSVLCLLDQKGIMSHTDDVSSDK